MKEGWKYKSFAECINKIPKQKQVKSKDYKSEGRFPIVSQEKELISGYWDDESFVFRHTKPIIIFGDHTKEIKYIDFDFVVGADGTQILSPKDDIDTKFFYYYLLATPIRSLGYARHFKLLKEKSFYIPSFDEQVSIVSRLDAAFAKIDALKANAERQLAEAHALFNRALTEEMTPKEGWEEKTLGEVCIKSKNIKWDTIDEDKSFIYIDLTSVDRTDLQIHNPQIINKHNAPSRAKQIVKTGDVIFATTRPTLRRVSLIDEQFDSNICSTGFCVLRPGKDVVSEWIFYALQEVSFYYYIEPLQAGANYPAVTDSDVKNYAIPIPPITNQHSIVSRLDALSANVRKMEELQRKTLLECDALKQSMLKEVFE